MRYIRTARKGEEQKAKYIRTFSELDEQKVQYIRTFLTSTCEKNKDIRTFPELDEQNILCMRSSKHAEPPPPHNDQFHQQTITEKGHFVATSGGALRGAISSAFSQEGPCLNTFSERGGGCRNQAYYYFERFPGYFV